MEINSQPKSSQLYPGCFLVSVGGQQVGRVMKVAGKSYSRQGLSLPGSWIALGPSGRQSFSSKQAALASFVS